MMTSYSGPVNDMTGEIPYERLNSMQVRNGLSNLLDFVLMHVLERVGRLRQRLLHEISGSRRSGFRNV